MKRVLVAIALVILSSAPNAAPTYKQARAIYDQLKQPFFDTGLFYKKPFQERLAYLNAAKALRDRSEKMFGVPSSCFTAANMRYEYVVNLHEYVNRLEGRISSQLEWKGVTDPMYSAFVFGESTAACYSDIDALESKK